MSDDRSPEEIQRALGGVAKAADDSTSALERQVKELDSMTKTSKSLGQKFESFATNLTSVASKLKEGSDKTSAYNEAIDKGGQVLSKFAMGINPVLGVLVKGISMYAQAVNKQADALYSSYKDISRLGATGASGITGVYDSMKKLGYGVNELDKMQGLLAESGTTLASLSGTVADGTKSVADMSRNIRDSDIGTKFMTMGISVDNMNKGIVSYLKIQTQVGRAQSMTADQLREGAAKYIESADKLTKITGLSIEQQTANEQRYQSEDRFGSWMERQEREGKGDQAKAVSDLSQVIEAQGPAGAEVAQGMRDAASKSITEASNKLLQTMPTVFAAVQRGGTKDEIQAAIISDTERNKKLFDQSREIAGTAAGQFTRTQLQAAVQGILGKPISEREAAATAGQAVTDKPTKNLTDFATSTRSARDSMQDLVQRGIEPATKTMAYLADKTAKVAGMPGAALGKNLGGYYVGQGEGGFLGGKPGQPVGPSKPTTGSSKEYYDKMYNKLLEEGKKQGIANPEAVARLGAAQTSLETGYGKHMVGNNAFGIKARNGQGGVGAQTQEFVNGKMVTMNQNFRSYKNPEESAADYIAFLKENPRYRDVLASKTAAEAISAQGRTGYATDPNYAAKLAGINASNAGPNSGRQGVQLPDATSTVGAKPESPGTTANMNQQVLSESRASMDRQLALSEEQNDLIRRSIQVQKNTNAKMS